jgi:hypothetical protein
MTKKIPEHMLLWMVSSRRELLKSLLEGKPVDFFSAHLPVLASLSENEDFVVNLSVKGIGLLPRQDLLEQYTLVFQETFHKASQEAWEKSLGQRSHVLAQLYSDPQNFDPTLLGGLEIFEGRTLRNLEKDTRVSLLFTGMKQDPQRMQYLSFQVDGQAEILNAEHPYARYLLAARKLFEFNNFHLPQIDYPFGYLIRVTEVLDKSPHIR